MIHVTKIKLNISSYNF